MKLKHFAGYGAVNAKKVSLVDNGDTTILTVLVTGDHEWGLYPSYVLPGMVNRLSDTTIKHWLIDRFDKRTKSITCFHYNMIVEPLTFDGQSVKYVFGYNNDGSIIY